MKAPLIAALLLVLAAGCGDSDGSDPKSSAKASESDQCRDVLAPAKDAVQEFASRFASGFSRDQFNDRAGDLRVALDQVDQTATSKIGGRCTDAYNELAKSKEQASMIDVAWDACETAAKFVEMTSCESSKDLLDATAYVRNLTEYVSTADNFIGQLSD